MLTPDKKPEISSQDLIKSYVISLVISVPLVAATIYLSQFTTEWPLAHLIFGGIMFISVLNFIALVFLEEIRNRIGKMTIPALLAAIALVLLLVIFEGIHKFMPDAGYQWFFPIVAFIIVFKYLAMFRERNLALKFYLAMNILSLAVLWGLGKADKIDLPF